MKEDNVIKWISPYIDGELDGEKRLKIEEYLSARPDIAAKFRAEARMEGVIKSMLRPDKAMEKAWTRATEKICVGDSQTINRWPALAAGLFFCFLLLGAWQTYVVANTDFIRSAIQYHKSYISDRVPLAFETGSFKELGEYFAQKMPGTVKCM